LHGDYWSQWGTLADQLAGLPAEIGTIVVACCRRSAPWPTAAPEVDGLTATPHLRTGFRRFHDVLAGSRLAAIDQELQAANTRIQDILKQGRDDGRQRQRR